MREIEKTFNPSTHLYGVTNSTMQLSEVRREILYYVVDDQGASYRRLDDGTWQLNVNDTWQELPDYSEPNTAELETALRRWLRTN